MALQVQLVVAWASGRLAVPVATRRGHHLAVDVQHQRPPGFRGPTRQPSRNALDGTPERGLTLRAYAERNIRGLGADQVLFKPLDTGRVERHLPVHRESGPVTSRSIHGRSPLTAALSRASSSRLRVGSRRRRGPGPRPGSSVGTCRCRPPMGGRERGPRDAWAAPPSMSWWTPGAGASPHSHPRWCP